MEASLSNATESNLSAHEKAIVSARWLDRLQLQLFNPTKPTYLLIVSQRRLFCRRSPLNIITIYTTMSNNNNDNLGNKDAPIGRRRGQQQEGDNGLTNSVDIVEAIAHSHRMGRRALAARNSRTGNEGVQETQVPSLSASQEPLQNLSNTQQESDQQQHHQQHQLGSHASPYVRGSMPPSDRLVSQESIVEILQLALQIASGTEEESARREESLDRTPGHSRDGSLPDATN